MGQSLVNSTEVANLDTYDKHRVSDLVLAHTTPKDYHPGFSRCTSELVQITDVLYDIDYETRGSERVEV